MKTSKLSDTVYALISELERLAQVRCQVGDTNGVHFLVSEQRRLGRLEHSMRMRGLLSEENK